MKLSVYLIVKNEAHIIGPCLAALKDFDEIVVVDTGSMDDTCEVVRRINTDGKALHNKITLGQFNWIDDFSAARNYALSLCTGDWCMQMDADHLLLTKPSVVRSECIAAERAGAVTANVKAQYPSGQWHWFSGMSKRGHGTWVGAVHECLMPAPAYNAKVVHQIGSSDSKKLDPERNLRILLKSDLTDPRNQFYLGKECYERGMFGPAVAWMRAYLEKPVSNAEIHWARLVIANCYWRDGSGRGNLAREEALKAHQQNPASREGIRLLAELHDEPWKSRWLRLLKGADDEGVLFPSGK